METALLFGQLRSNNVYLNQPDNYFPGWPADRHRCAAEGGTESICAPSCSALHRTGYNEDQFSLPRWLRRDHHTPEHLRWHLSYGANDGLDAGEEEGLRLSLFCSL